jgi:hypothetical protein
MAGKRAGGGGQRLARIVVSGGSVAGNCDVATGGVAECAGKSCALPS